jgi:hypothetical protein
MLGSSSFLLSVYQEHVGYGQVKDCLQNVVAPQISEHFRKQHIIGRLAEALMFDYLALYFLNESDFDNFYFRTQVSSDPTQTWRSQEIGFGKSYS